MWFVNKFYFDDIARTQKSTNNKKWTKIDSNEKQKLLFSHKWIKWISIYIFAPSTSGRCMHLSTTDNRTFRILLQLSPQSGSE